MSEVTPHDLHVLLVEIRGDVKATKEAVDRHLDDDKAVHSDHENRLRRSERALWGISGMGVLVAVIGSYIGFFQ